MIVILCPTRGRPDSVKRLLSSAQATADHPDQLRAVFYVDEDDPTMPHARWNAIRSGIKVQGVEGPRIVLSEMWNRCYELAVQTWPEADIFFQCGDDIVFQSQGWDSMVEGAFALSADKILLVHGRDGVHDERFGTHCFLSRRWIDAVGAVVPAFYSSCWADQVLNDIGNELGRRMYLPDVYTEHLHPDVGKAVHDQTHLERMVRGAQDDVMGIYNSEQQREWTAGAVARLRAACAVST